MAAICAAHSSGKKAPLSARPCKQGSDVTRAAATCIWTPGPAVQPHLAEKPADVSVPLGSCQEEENAAAARIVISDDLVARARAQVKFLAAVEGANQLHAPENALKIVRRYARFWLPLLAKHGESAELMPPLDVEWAWHCHLLNPLAYRAECEQLAGRVLDHSVIKDKALALGTAMSLWASEYPGEPWALSDASEPANRKELSAIESYVLAAMARQKMFYGEVCANEPRINETAYLENALQRYRKFLHLAHKTRDTGMSIIPTRDVDLMWHAHQRSPLAYAADCIRLMGDVIGHDDTYEPEADDFEAFFAVAGVWQAVYGDVYDTSAAEGAEAPDAVACKGRCLFYALRSDALHISMKKPRATACRCQGLYATDVSPKHAAVPSNQKPSAQVCRINHCLAQVIQNPAAVPCREAGRANAASSKKRPAAFPCGSSPSAEDAKPRPRRAVYKYHHAHEAAANAEAPGLEPCYLEKTMVC